jgi:hypothetical protein
MYRWTGVLLTCAWILWMQEGGDLTRVVNSYLTKPECDTERQVRLQRQQQQGGIYISWVCLPDTVNLLQQTR